MDKKIIALSLAAVIMAGVFAGCKKNGEQTYNEVAVEVTDSDYNPVTDEDGNNVTQKVNAKTDKNGVKLTQAVTDKQGREVTRENGEKVTEYVTVSPDNTTTNSSDKYLPSGWKRVDGTARIVSNDGNVSAEFDKLSPYTSADIDKIESELKNIIQKGLSSGKVTGSAVKGKTVEVTGYGVPVSGKSKMYYKLYCVADKTGAYLVTFSSAEESYLDGDLSEVTKNVKDLSGLV